MWINRKEIAALREYVESVYKDAVESGNRVLLNYGDPKALQNLMESNIHLRLRLATLIGRLEAITTRW